MNLAGTFTQADEYERGAGDQYCLTMVPEYGIRLHANDKRDLRTQMAPVSCVTFFPTHIWPCARFIRRMWQQAELVERDTDPVRGV